MFFILPKRFFYFTEDKQLNSRSASSVCSHNRYLRLSTYHVLEQAGFIYDLAMIFSDTMFHTLDIGKVWLAALVAQVVSRQPVGRRVSGSIPGASRPSVCRPRLRPPGAGMGSHAAVAWRRRRSPPVNGHPWPVGGRMNKKRF